MQASSRAAALFNRVSPRLALGLPLCLAFAAMPLYGQTSQPAPASAPQQGYSASAPSLGEISNAPNPAAGQKAPAVIDASGPATALETSESLFDVMAALNTCGYDEGLAVSDPVRQKVREDIAEALAQSEPARESRDQLCAFMRSHTLNSPRLNLAQYISLALYLTPPPELTPNVGNSDLPPDAAPLVELLPKLRAFARAVDLHLIWVLNREAYTAEVQKLHQPLTEMILQVDLYLKQPPATTGNRRFLVLLEPLIAPGQVNARVYGGDYIVVASPVNGQIDLGRVKHMYLHFELEPLIYARSEAIDELAPILALVQPAPLAYEYKSDILALVTECMIRAIEARTMDTGIPMYHAPAHFDRNQLAAINSAENAYERKVAKVRQDAVGRDMVQGFILTQYFYDLLPQFEQGPKSLQEAVGEMVYGMNVDIEKHRVQNIQYDMQAEPDEDGDVVQRTVPRQTAMLDVAERKLASGDTAGAAQLARQALAQHTGDPGRAQFILARAAIFNGKMEDAVQAFQQAVRLSHDPRTIAWSHIYLGRLDDLQDNRQAAMTEYQAALENRDGRPDTKQAAEAGLKKPFAPPHARQNQAPATEAVPATGNVPPSPR